MRSAFAVLACRTLPAALLLYAWGAIAWYRGNGYLR
jgi:hypothetical protein